MKLKLKSRLMLSLGLLTVLSLLIGATGIVGVKRLNKNMVDTLEINNPEMLYAMQLQVSIQDRLIAVRNIMLFTDPQLVAQEVSRIKSQEAIYRDAYQKLGQMFDHEQVTSEEEKRLFAQLGEYEAAALPAFHAVMEAAVKNDVERAVQLALTELRPKQRKWTAAAVALKDKEIALNQQASLEAKSNASTTYTTILLLSLAALVVSVIVSIRLTRSTMKQLGGDPDDAQAIAREIAAGNLAFSINTVNVPSDSLIASLEQMRISLNHMVAEIKGSADAIANSAGEIAEGNIDLSRRTEGQAASLEETAASMEEITSTIGNNSNNALQGQVVAEEALRNSNSGGEVVQRVLAAMNKVSDGSKRMTEVIGTIEGIAFQTNILALNAAVEAARAGEQGRGFAVVASEVRALAQRCAAASQEIRGLIMGSASDIDIGSVAVQEAGRSMAEITQSISRVSAIMREVVTASVEQRAGVEQVNSAIISMDDVTQQNAALVEQATAAAHALANQASGLRATVARFTVGTLDRPQTAALTNMRPVQAGSRPAVR